MASPSASAAAALLRRVASVPHNSSRPQTSRVLLRRASSKAAPSASRPLILEKPAKFNPPSHGARLPKKRPQHYGGSLSSEELQAQRRTDYPGMMPPTGTPAHWFWSSRRLHMAITVGTLTSLAAFVFVENFKQTSPFAHMVPPMSDFFYHPVNSFRTVVEIIRLSEAHQSAIVAEKRRRKVDDVVKRSNYRKAHGLSTEQGFGGWVAKTDAESLGPSLPVDDGSADLGTAERRKKFLGIF